MKSLGPKNIRRAIATERYIQRVANGDKPDGRGHLSGCSGSRQNCTCGRVQFERDQARK